jgi:redox-sensitive bicupin YhaK (pirin superfamily)
LHVAHGALVVQDKRLAAGDALKIERVGEIVLQGGAQAEVLLFDLP